MATILYTCPICGLPTTLTEEGISLSHHTLWIENALGLHVLRTVYRVCPNPECRQFSLEVALHKAVAGVTSNSVIFKELVRTWTLVPPSTARAFPSYIPEAIRLDYEEACAIREASPKASATLSRRCLQGMIRNFWGIKKNRLIDEIDELKDRVDELTWQVIDALRNVGNIGVHMEKDVNVIVDVEPDEAEKLIWLIETLIKEWYINREERRVRLSEIIAVADNKRLPPEPATTRM